MKIYIKTIPHEKQRYETCGDYWLDDRNIIQIRISKTKSDYEFLILIHELIEAYLAIKHEIEWEKIDKFDIQFKGTGEPGDAKDAPYRREHRFAENVERILAHELNVDWFKYDQEVDKL